MRPPLSVLERCLWREELLQTGESWGLIAERPSPRAGILERIFFKRREKEVYDGWILNKSGEQVRRCAIELDSQSQRS